MNHRITAGLRSIARARSVLLAVLAVNAVVLPCAMAVGLDDRSCLHAPPAGQHGMAGHDEMVGHHGHDGHEGHAARSCADTQCCVVEAASVDSRSGQQKVRDAGDWDAAPVVHAAVPPACRVSRSEPVERPPDEPGAFPPRHKLFCVYLD